MKASTIAKIIIFPLEPLFILLLGALAIAARFTKKKVDIGLGPLPLINNLYHKKVFERSGYSAETFVNQVWHITSQFDLRCDQSFLNKIPVVGARINTICIFAWCIFRYRCLLIYFNGGPLGLTNTTLLWRVEPFFLSIANVKTIVLAYGADVQVMSRSPNLLFKDAMSKDYPNHRILHKRLAGMVDLWTAHGSYTVGGCEWVDYMHHWDALMVSHFSIDTDNWRDEKPQEGASAHAAKSGTLKVLHAPNHREIKGTRHLINAIEELKSEGLDVELILVEKRPNEEIRRLITEVDVVVDQLIIGWYAMFAIEAMSLNKPVICNVRSDLENLYRATGLYKKEEVIPLIHACPLTIKSVLKDLYENRTILSERGAMGRDYVMRHHSIGAIQKTFSKIANELIGQPKGI